MMDYDQFAQQLKDQGAFSAPVPNPIPGTPAPPTPVVTSEPAQDDNPYAAFGQTLKAGMDQRATANLISAHDANPDQAARALTLAPQVGVPQPAVEADLPHFEQQAKLQQNRQILEGNPDVSSWVASNPLAARVGHDDLGSLDFLSKTAQAWKSGWAMAPASNQLGRLYSDKQLGQASPALDKEIHDEEGQLSSTSQFSGVLGGVQQVAGFASGLLDNFLHSQRYVYTGAAAGAAVGTAFGGVGAAPGAAIGAGAGITTGIAADMARVASGQTYRALNAVRDSAGNPLDETSKQVGSLLSGALTFGLGMAGVRAGGSVASDAISPFMSEAVTQAMTRPTVSAAIGNFAKAAVKGGVTGAALNAGMEAASLAGRELGKQLGNSDFKTIFNDDTTRQQAISQLADAAESGALLFGGMHAAGRLVGLSGEILRARQSADDVATFQQLEAGAADSKLRTRSPDAFQQFMQSQTDGTPVENLFVPADAIMRLYQSSGLDPRAGGPDPLFGWVPDMRQQLDEAGPIGGDVVLPTADYITHMAGTDISRALLPDIRVRQDGMSMNDARTFLQSTHDDLARDAYLYAGADADPTQKIFDDVLQQSTDVGHTPEVAQQHAALYAARYGARGARLGIDPMELYRQSGVQLREGDAPSDSTGNAFNQAQLNAEPHTVETKEFKRWFGDSKAVDANGNPQPVFHGTSRGGFDTFDAYGEHGLFGQGVYTTENPDVASSYTKKGRGDSPTVYPLYAKIAHPIDMDAAADRSKWEKAFPDIDFNEYHEGGTSNESYYRAAEEFYRDEMWEKWEAAEDIQAKLRSMGYDGITHVGGGRAKNSDVKHRVWIAFDPEQLKSATGNNGEFNRDDPNILHQGERGSITFANGQSIINLFRDRDLSTMLHETGHLWLEELQADAARPDAPQQLRDDLATVRNWMGLKDGEGVQVEQHEQFARAAEAYFMEGKAPTKDLADVFQRFKSWLTTIYRSVANLRTPINDDIRGVFDRMLATDEQLEDARRSQRLQATFRDPAEAGMTKKEFDAYQKTIDRANTAAESELLPKVMERVREERTADWKTYHAKIKAEVTKEVDARPEMQALAFLRSGATPEGMEAIPKTKLSEPDLVASYGADIKDRLPKGLTRKKSGTHPDDVAEIFGLSSGDDLVKKLLDLEQQERDIRKTPGERRTARQYIIDRRTDFRMSEERPDILDDGSIRDEAIDAIHNQEMQRALTIELRAIGRKSRQEAFSTADARAWAKEQIGNKTVREAQLTGKYSRAEAKAARMVERALIDGDTAAAFQYKRQQILNHHLYVAAREASEEIQAASKVFNRYSNKRTMAGLDQGYLDQIHALLDRFDFGDASEREVKRRKSLRDWAEQQEALGNEVDVPPELLDAAFQKHYSDLTVDQFRGLRDSVDNIAHLGRMKATLLDGADVRDFDSVVNEAVAAAGELRKRSQPNVRNPGVGGKGLDRIQAKFLSAGTTVRSLDAALLKMEQVFDWLDKHDSNGVFNRVVFRRLADAGVRENDLRIQISKQLHALQKAMPKDVAKDWLTRYEIPELPDNRIGGDGGPSRMLKKEIIAMALNVGNDSNFGKLMGGEKWSRDAIWTVLNRHMTKADWDFVQGVWNTIETLWPEIEAMERRLSGVAPEKIRPTEVTTPFGRYRGGYYPTIYDPLRSYSAELNRQRSGDRLFENNYVRATTEKGHTLERIHDYSAPIYLSLDALPRHLTQVTHDLAYREAVMDADRFLSDPRIREAVESTLGREIYQQFRPWLQSIANDKVYDQRGLAWWDRVAHGARTTSTMVGLGFRATTMMIHGMTAASNSVGEIGARWMLSGSRAFFGSPAKMVAARDFIFERSGEMRNRMNEVDRDVRDALREMDARSGGNPVQRAADTARRFAYFGISMLDMGSALPTWMGAYNKALHGGMSEADAIYAADKAVRNAHGGGGIKDQAAIQRGSEFQKLFTMFYSFWNHFYNRQRDIARTAGNGIANVRDGEYRAAAHDFGIVLARSFFYFVVPQLIHAAIKPSPAKSGDDEHGWAAWAAEEIGLGLLSGIPILRDIANSAATGRAYSATPAAQMVNSILQSATDIGRAVGLSDKDVSPKWVKHSIQNAGYAFGLPTGQVSNAGQFLWDVMNADQNPQDVTDWLHGLVYGTTKEKK